MNYTEMFRVVRITLDQIQKRFIELEYRQGEQNEVIDYLREKIEKIDEERRILKGRNEQLIKEHKELFEELKKIQ